MAKISELILAIIKKQLKLSPDDPKQKLRLVIDGAWTVGTGFLLIQYVYDKDMAKLEIIHLGSNVLPLDQDFSSMEAEAIALDRAIIACHHCLYYCPKSELFLDCCVAESNVMNS